ncbi:DUF5134 domain-containing protein [Amycolatopsis cihanbeyliensis]|uniref:Uncharacterized protein DUF5134 n=1 Tax=Amycolatopsis cihanbeyliensis TaxID=1128664 RepID=A0A542DD17_AMYCI|nr:DUF5134 domain-containing protein [Amycolatopsis cihanbeyliensis]TQJ00964.1 uncharacterized protein DUF5134 [Amycolatopsis cihanbeyliensis]
MTSPLLPEWLRIVLAAVLCGVAVLHVGHVLAMRGQRRWWHAGHTVMALGMAAMYLLPRMRNEGLYEAGLVLFALFTVAVVIGALLIRRNEGVLNPLWIAAGVDMVAMTYMLLPMSGRFAPVTYLFVGYLGCQAVAWVTGLWGRVPVLRPVLAGAPDAPEAAAPAVALTAHSAPTVPPSLAVMAATMAYMLAAM